MINIFKKLSYFLLLSLLGLDCFAQTSRLPFNYVEKFKLDGGSFGNHVNFLYEDKNDYLWIGTNAGLKRYDIKNTITFKHAENDPKSLANNVVNTICEDNQGRIWVGTAQGLCYFDKKENRFITIKALNKLDYNVLNLICDYEGKMWFTISHRGLYCFDTKTNKIKNFQHNPKNPNSIDSNLPFSKGVCEDPFKKGLWISTDEGLNFFEYKTETFYNKNNNPEKLPIFKSDINGITIHKNQLVFGDNKLEQIVFYDIQKKIISKTISVKLQSKKSIFNIYKIFFDQQENIWLASVNEVAAIVKVNTGQAIELIYDPNGQNSISDYEFNDIVQQKNGIIWVGTYSGMDVIDPENKLFDFYNLQDNTKPDSENYLNFFVEDHTDSTWWLTDISSNLIHFKPNTGELQKYSLPKSHDNSNFISLEDFGESMIAITNREAFIFNKIKKSFSKINLPINFLQYPNLIITKTLLVDQKLWFFFKGRDFDKAYCYGISMQNWTDYPILPLPKGSRYGVSSAILSKEGNIWLAIDGTGLAKFSPVKKAFEIVKTKQNINFDKVRIINIDEDKKGFIWISTYDLIRFDPKTKDFISIVDTDFQGSIAVDMQDNVWVNIYSDILIYLQESKQKLYLNILMSPSEEKSYWGSHVYKLKNGKIVALIKERIVLIEPRFLKQISTKDKIQINKISTPDTTILIHKNDGKVNFGVNDNSFAIAYGIASAPNVTKYKFYYKLEGYDKDWLPSENYLMADYGNISGGDYAFKVKATDFNNRDLPTQSLSIHIDTIFYKTTWFRLLGLISTVFFLYIFIKYRTDQRTKMHHLQLQFTRLEKDKTEIQYHNLINHLNPHFLFNSLSSLSGLILSEPDLASDFLQKLSKIYRYILQTKENEVVSLEQELAFVENYVSLQKSRFDDGLQVNINIDDEYSQSGIVPVTLQNLFENAIKHNTIEEDKPLIINVFIESEYLIVKNNLQKKSYVETSNKQGIDTLKSLYTYLSSSPLETIETETEFVVRVPLL